jgi:hypothetical protein
MTYVNSPYSSLSGMTEQVQWRPSETRDRIVENCLRIQLGDEALAHDLYADLREQLVRTPERRYDMTMSAALAPWTGGPASGRGAMFVATIRTEYRLLPLSPVLRFTCVSDLDEYRESLQDPSERRPGIRRVGPAGSGHRLRVGARAGDGAGPRTREAPHRARAGLKAAGSAARTPASNAHAHRRRGCAARLSGRDAGRAAPEV